MNTPAISVLVVSTKNGKPVENWKKLKLKENETLETIILQLRSKKETFKVAEKKYYFNGNNYIIS